VTALQGPAERTRHWDRLYRRLDETQASWCESDPACSTALLNALGVGPDLSVVDIGAGAPRLIDTCWPADSATSPRKKLPSWPRRLDDQTKAAGGSHAYRVVHRR
jgi:hypothetical protein